MLAFSAAAGPRPGNATPERWAPRCGRPTAYEEVQFTKAPEILCGLGLENLEKTEKALAELRDKDLA